MLRSFTNIFKKRKKERFYSLDFSQMTQVNAGRFIVSNGTVALEDIQVYLFSLLALFQVLIAVFLHALDVCSTDEMGALIQRTAFRQIDEGTRLSVSLMSVNLQQLSLFTK